VYTAEVRRTNRIGVSLTGIHEFAWRAFGFSFRDLIDEEKSMLFWLFLSDIKRAVVDEAIAYSEALGVNTPHTNTTIKPAGTTSKLFGLTEGAHLPAVAYYMRWVQFSVGDPLVEDYERGGYPIKRNVKGYESVAIVGFPTCPAISKMGMGDKLVTATQATLQEQFQWLRLLEKYWIVGIDENGESLPDTGGQISYTAKYDPGAMTRDEFAAMLWSNQESVRCCAVMPQVDATAYAYQPEEPISAEEYDAAMARIVAKPEQIDTDSLRCMSGACPL
jgi:hypothetical protein